MGRHALVGLEKEESNRARKAYHKAYNRNYTRKTPVSKEYFSTYYQEHKDEARQRQRKLRTSPIYKEKERAWNKKSYDKKTSGKPKRIRKTIEEQKLDTKNRRLLREYGITLAQYDQLAESLNHECQICHEKKKLYIDHDHKTGAIRGLLCHNCNTGIGHLRDSPALVEEALRYLTDK